MIHPGAFLFVISSVRQPKPIRLGVFSSDPGSIQNRVGEQSRRPATKHTRHHAIPIRLRARNACLMGGQAVLLHRCVWVALLHIALSRQIG